MPTLAGFLAFVRGLMQIGPTALPNTSPAIRYAFTIALEIVNDQFAVVVPDVYRLMVYNLAADALINFAPDALPDTTFSQARKKFGLDGAGPFGILQSTSDESTSSSYMIPDVFKQMTLADLSYLKTPWGRNYISLAQRFGADVWGIS